MRVHVRFDLMKLKQILLNPLSNAFKFTNEGEVALRERKVADGRDCGPTRIGTDVQLGRTFFLRA
jgi:signal transduction histidine kinase